MLGWQKGEFPQDYGEDRCVQVLLRMESQPGSSWCLETWLDFRSKRLHVGDWLLSPVGLERPIIGQTGQYGPCSPSKCIDLDYKFGVVRKVGCQAPSSQASQVSSTTEAEQWAWTRNISVTTSTDYGPGAFSVCKAPDL